MDYHQETEADTRANRIDPVLAASGWTAELVRREVICPGRIQSGGKRGKGLSCDYVLFYKGQKIATLEAKRAGLSHREGIGQTKDYATRLGCRFAFASNGLKWYQIDMATGKEGESDLPFPTPDDLWKRTFEDDNQWRERFGDVPFEADAGKWEPRYYQHRAITSALEAIGQGRDRILLTLATGTGKTSIAFQIAWKLFQSSWNLSREPNRRPRILFLTDRNILANQAFNSFSAFPSDAIVRIDPEAIGKRGSVPKNASVFFTIFQTFMTGEGKPSFTGYQSDFFDFIIIDECHRGGANDEGSWRAILEYFSPAVQLGLTATPKRTHNVDTYNYFGEPVYSYALKDGINDGYLTPFKVRQIASTIDDYIFDGSDDLLSGEIEEGAKVTEAEFNRKVEIEERERSRVREFLAEINPREKSLVFCASQNHAALVRDLINQEPVSENPNYCQRVTSADGKMGEQYLRDFQDNDKTIPTILTTSHKLSTGVDARNVRNIILMRPINSMIEFKQIIGRGTRTYDGKDFFTIIDFVKAYELFHDPAWDGPPEEFPEPEPKPPGGFHEPPGEGPTELDPPLPKEKIVIKLSDGKERSIQYMKATNYMGPGGKFMSAQQFLEMLFGDLKGMVADEDQLRKKWSNPETRQRFMEQLREKEYTNEILRDVKALVDAPNSDLFDVLSYILFTHPPLTREQRADNVKKDGLGDIAEDMREFLLRVLTSYIQLGEDELSDNRLAQHMKAMYGSVSEGASRLGNTSVVREAYLRMQEQLYS